MFGVETLLPLSTARLEPFGMQCARVREEGERCFSTQRDVRGVIKELPALIRFGPGEGRGGGEGLILASKRDGAI